MPVTTIITTVPPKTDSAFHPSNEDPAAAGWGPRSEAARPPGPDSATRFHPA
jgi:hypothetical protein